MEIAGMGVAAGESERNAPRHRGKGGFLLAMAGALGEMQGKFLERALKNLDTMAGLSDQEGTGASREFLVAQGEFQANMQMFNITSQAAANALRSTGEGMAAVVRQR